MRELIDGFKTILDEFDRLQAELEEGRATKEKEAGLLTVEEIAEKLRVPVSWIYAQTQLTDGTGISHLKLGRYCRFKLLDVMTWIEGRQG